MEDSNNDIIKKERQKKLDHLNSIQYNILLKQKNNKFCLVIPELSLISVEDNLEAAYRELCAKKTKLFNDVLEYGTEETINLPNKIQKRYEIFNQLKIFIYKLLLTCLLGGVLFMLGIAEIKSNISSTVNMLAVDKIKTSIIQELNNFINVPEDAKQKKIKKLHDALNGLSPFINEFRSAFKNPPEQKNSY
jgi:hypothetical protein